MNLWENQVRIPDFNNIFIKFGGYFGICAKRKGFSMCIMNNKPEESAGFSLLLRLELNAIIHPKEGYG